MDPSTKIIRAATIMSFTVILSFICHNSRQLRQIYSNINAMHGTVAVWEFLPENPSMTVP